MSNICGYCKKEHDAVVSGHMKQIGKLQKTNTEQNMRLMKLMSVIRLGLKSGNIVNFLELAEVVTELGQPRIVAVTENVATPAAKVKSKQLKTWAQLKQEWATADKELTNG